MKIRSITLTFLAVLTVSLSYAQGIQFFDGSWDEALVKAKAENKSIMVDGYASWCGPCKWMTKNIFPEETVGTYYNDNYISLKWDMEKEGKWFAEKHDINVYPTFTFFDQNGVERHRSAGGMPSPDFIDLGKTAMSSDKCIACYQERYDKSERDPEFLYEYSLALHKARLNAQPIAEDYVNSINNDDDWLSQKNWDFAKLLVRDFNSSVFKMVVANRENFKPLISNPEEIEMYIDQSITNEINSIAKSYTEGDLSAFKTSLSYILPDLQGKYEAKADYVVARVNNHENAFDKMHTYMTRYCADWQLLNSEAWTAFETLEDERQLNLATTWALKSVEIDRNFYNIDTYANLLYKTGQLELARSFAKEAIQLAKKEEIDAPETQELLNEIEKAL